MSEERLARLLKSMTPVVTLSNGANYNVTLRRDGKWVYFTAHDTTDGEQVAETGVKFSDLMTIDNPNKMGAFWDCLKDALSESRRLTTTTYFLFSHEN